MPLTQYPKILAFVEGSMERLFINNNFHYVNVVTVSNGTSWTVEALCRQIATFYRAKNFNADAIVVWIDRERRAESADLISNEIRAALIDAGASAEKIHLLISDMTVENIILSDEVFMRELTKDSSYSYIFEGKSGKVIIKNILESINIRYKEISVGSSYLKKIRLSNSASKSPSVARFTSSMKFECWWI